MASKRVQQIIEGIKRLNPTEKAELAQEMAGNNYARKQILEEEFRKAYAVHTAPAGSGGCVCCGN